MNKTKLIEMARRSRYSRETIQTDRGKGHGCIGFQKRWASKTEEMEVARNEHRVQKKITTGGSWFSILDLEDVSNGDHYKRREIPR